MKRLIFLFFLLIVSSCTNITETREVPVNVDNTPNSPENSQDTLSYILNLQSYDENGSNFLDNQQNIVVFCDIDGEIQQHNVTPIENEIEIVYSGELPTKIKFSIVNDAFFSWDRTLLNKEIASSRIDVYLIRRTNSDKNAHYMLNTTTEERAFWFASLTKKWQQIFYREIIKKPLLPGINPSDSEIKLIFSDTILNCSGDSLNDDSGLRYLTNLKHLDISNNSLKTLNGIMNLSNLKTLIIANNKLQFLSPDFFKNSLEKINAANNALMQLVIENSNIKSANFANNKIIFSSIANVSLEDLDLQKNKLLLFSITGSKKLKELHLQNNEIKKISLNEGILRVNCSNNLIEEITLPSTTKWANFENNNLSVLNGLNCALQYLNINGNDSKRLYKLGNFTVDTLKLERELLEIELKEQEWWSVLPEKVKLYFASVLNASQPYKYITKNEYHSLTEKVEKIEIVDCEIKDEIFYNKLIEFSNLKEFKLTNCNIKKTFANKFYKDTLDNVEITNCVFSSPIEFKNIKNLKIESSKLDDFLIDSSINVNISNSVIENAKINSTIFISSNTIYDGDIKSLAKEKTEILGGSVSAHSELFASGSSVININVLPSKTTILGNNFSTIKLQGASNVVFSDNATITKEFVVSDLNCLNITASALLNSKIDKISIISKEISFDNFVADSVFSNISELKIETDDIFDSFDLTKLTHLTMIDIKAASVNSFKTPERPNNIRYSAGFSPRYFFNFSCDSLVWPKWEFNKSHEVIQQNSYSSYWTIGEYIRFSEIQIKNIKNVDLTFGAGNFGLWGGSCYIEIENAEKVICPQTDVSDKDTISPWLIKLYRPLLSLKECKNIFLDKNLFSKITISDADFVQFGDPSLLLIPNIYDDERYFNNIFLSKIKKVKCINTFIKTIYFGSNYDKIEALDATNSYFREGSIYATKIMAKKTSLFNYMRADSIFLDSLETSSLDFGECNYASIKNSIFSSSDWINEYSNTPKTTIFTNCFFDSQGTATLGFFTQQNKYLVYFNDCIFKGKELKIDNDPKWQRSPKFYFNDCFFPSIFTFNIYNTSHFYLSIKNSFFVEERIFFDRYGIVTFPCPGDYTQNMLENIENIVNLCDINNASSYPYYSHPYDKINFISNHYIERGEFGEILTLDNAYLTPINKDDLSLN